MFKKNSWIVALLLALSFSIFLIGCVDALVEPPDGPGGGGVTYTEVALPAFNAWGGNAENQAGWGTDGATYDSGKKTVKPIEGFTIENLQKAKYLVLEMNDGFPKNGVETIWDSWDADGKKLGDWLQNSNITGTDGKPSPGQGGKLEGNTFTLELSKAIKNYALFKDTKTAAITLLIQHWGNGGTVAAIKSAKLMIPDVVEPIPPDPDLFVEGGAYKVPNAYSATAFYLDLNGTRAAAVGGIPNSTGSKIEADKLTVAFNKNDDAFYVPFTADQAEYVTHAAEQGFTVKIKVDTAAGAYPSNFRWALTNNTTSNWNSYALQDTVGSLNSTVTLSGGANKSPKGFIFQVRTGSTYPSSVVITKIWIEVSGSGSAPTALSALNFGIRFVSADKPYAGNIAPDTVTAGTGYSGEITWTPELPSNGKFKTLTQYTANIVVTTNLGYYIANSGVTASISTATLLSNAPAAYNAATQTVTYTFDNYTGANPEPADRPEYSGTSFNVTAYTGATPTTKNITGAANVKARNGRIAYRTDSRGFIFSSQGEGGGYQEEYPAFKVNFGKNLTADSRIIFKYKGIDGDIGWKSVGIYASTTEPVTTGASATDINVSSSASTALGGVIWTGSYADDGTKETVFTAKTGAINLNQDVWFVISMHGGKQKAFEIYDIQVKDPLLQNMVIKVDGSNKTVTGVTGVNAVTEYLDGNNGYKWTQGSGGYQGNYAYFPVTLNAGEKIADYSSIKFDIEGSGSDSTWKGLGVIVSATAFTGDMSATARATNLNNGYTSGKLSKEIAIATTNVAGNGFYFDSAATGVNLFVSIYVHAPTGAAYEITNIEFVKVPPVPAVGVTINESAATIEVDDTKTYTVTKNPLNTTDTLSWSSGDTSVATVGSTSGIVTGKAAGEAVITATLGTKTDTVTVTVSGLVIDEDSLTIDEGASDTPTLTKYGEASSETPTWESDDTDVATVNASSGLVEGVAPGIATITVTAGTYTTSIGVTVSGIVIDGGDITLDGTQILTVTAYGDAIGEDVTWASDDGAVTVDASTGEVESISSGSATITATAGTYTATITVTVN